MSNLPGDTEAAELLERLGVDPIDRAETLAARPDPDAHPELWQRLVRGYRELLADLGTPPAGGGWPALPAETGARGRFLYVWLCLAALPHVRRYHAEHGVPDDISWDSLRFLGLNLASERLTTGTGGLSASWGLPRVFGGTSYRLGRLVFDRQRPVTEPAGHPVLRRGESGLNTHIPYGSPLDPAACDASFTAAREFFPARFPEAIGGFCCHSWLMDDQLADYLPETANIMRFQRRWHGFNDREQADWAVLEHVFRRKYAGPRPPAELLDELPQVTTLQRAIVAHVRSGRHWYNQTGWFAF
jgi:GNAT-like C-terminal domain/N-acyltransferase N-terminal domain